MMVLLLLFDVAVRESDYPDHPFVASSCVHGRFGTYLPFLCNTWLLSAVFVSTKGLNEALLCHSLSVLDFSGN